jgi:hypothetical protein
MRRTAPSRSPRRDDAASLSCAGRSPSTNPPATGSLTAQYEIHIKGRVGEELAAAFEPLASAVHPVETVLHGEIADQAALHGVLDRVQALGLELIEVRRLPESVPDAVRRAGD